MRLQVTRSQASVCHLCQFIIGSQLVCSRPRRQARQLADGIRQYATTRRVTPQDGRAATNPVHNTKDSNSNASGRHTLSFDTQQAGNLVTPWKHELQEVLAKGHQLLQDPAIPDEAEVIALLKSCQNVAEQLIDPHQPRSKKGESIASALLSIDQSTATPPASALNEISPATQKTINQLSELAHSVLSDSPVFITPGILESYVDLQTLLKKPYSFPEIFHLYSSKPVPEQGSTPITYKTQNPNAASSAIPIAVADKALQSATDAKLLDTAMEIVETSYATKAFRKAKFVRKALLPVTGLAVAPVAAYSIASQLSLYQTTMENVTATNIAFAGILTYLGSVATIGIVAVTTANDQMDRITWATGMPLRERWIREEERAAVDRIAGAWGFRQSWKRGEEEGPDWNAIREWAGLKGMVLDRVDLMEGME